MKAVLLVLTGLACTISPLPGNGGGYRAMQQGTGSLDLFTPDGTDTVQIVREDLNISLGVRAASVEVRYRMKNTGPKVRATIGFPVEMARQDLFAVEVAGTSKPPSAESLNAWIVQSGYSIAIDGESLGTRPVIEPPDSAKIDERRRNLLGWIVSTIPFKADAEHEVAIRFKTDLSYHYSFMSSNYQDTGSQFFYRLSTGAVWKGPIASGRVTVVPTGSIPPTIARPADVFRNVGGVWTWDFVNLEPTIADDIQIAVTLPRDSHQAFDARGERSARYSRIGSQWHLEHQDYTVQASSTLKPEDGITYQAANVRGPGAWSEGSSGDGTGEWLELTLDPPRVLDFLEISSGYQDWRKPGVYEANHRPAKIRIACDARPPMHRNLADEPFPQLVPLDPSTTPVKRLRIEFLGVYRGSQHDDLCVSEIALLTPLKNKPAFRGSR